MVNIHKAYIGDNQKWLPKLTDKVQLVMTSPPYFNERDYSTWATFEKYAEDMRKVIQECYRLLDDGRIICWNVATLPKIDLSSYSSMWLQEAGFQFRDKIIWCKPPSQSLRLATFNIHPYPMYYYPDNNYEEVLVYQKGTFKGHKKQNKIDVVFKKEVLSSLWKINPVIKINQFGVNKYGHIAPYPIDLPKRCIKLYSYSGETVLDPFSGSFKTFEAARATDRNSTSIELHKKYFDVIKPKLSFGNDFFGNNKYEVFYDEYKEGNRNKQ